MRLSLFAVIFALVSLIGTAYSQVNVLERWNITPKHTTKLQNGASVDLQMFQRVIGMQGNVYPVASISYIRQDIRVNDRLDYRDLLAKFRLGYGIQKWKISDYRGSKVFEGKLTDQSRNMRISITEKHKEIIVSVASYRRGYARAIHKEIVQVQDGLSKLKNKGIVQSVFETLLISSAYAQDLDLGGILDKIPDPGVPGDTGIAIPPINTGIDISGDIDISGNIDVSGDVNTNITGKLDQDQFDSIMDQGDRLTGAAGDINTTLDNQLTTANQTGKDAVDMLDRQGTAANKNWADSNKILDKNWTETNRVIDKNWTESNKQLARANAVAEKMSDPKHMMLLSGATAAGAVFGASLANLAIDGLKFGLDFIIEQITDTKGKAKRWALFADARKKWNETIKHANKLEKAIDNFIGYYDVFKSLREKDPSANIETIIRHFSKEAYKAKKIRDKYERKLNEAETLECEDEYADKLVEQDAIIDQLEGVRDILTKHMKDNPDADIFDERFFCSQLGNMIRNLLDAESTLQDYRIFMIDGKAEFGEALKDQAEQIYDASEHYNKNKQSLKSRELKQEKKRHQMAIDQLEEMAEKRCKAKGVSWSNRSDCVSKELSSGSLQRRKESLSRKLRQVNASIEKSYGDDDAMLSVNERVISDRVKYYNDWFKEIEGQQYCSQNPAEAACREMSKFAYNGNFYLKEKAMERMDNICPNNDMSLYDIKQRMSKDGEPEVSVVDPQGNNKEVLRKKPSAPKKKSGKGFFSSLFDGVKSFFKGIGDTIGNFFGGAGRTKTLGESRQTLDLPGAYENVATPAVSPFTADQGPVVNTSTDERVTRENPKDFKALYPNAYFGLVKVEPSPSDAQVNALAKLMEQEFVAIPESDEFAYKILKQSGYISNGKLDMNKLKESGNVDTFKLFVSLIINTHLK